MMVSTVFASTRMAAVVCSVFGTLVVGVSSVVLPQITMTGMGMYFLESLIPFMSPLNILHAIGTLEGTCFSATGRRIACSPGQHPPGFTLESFYLPVSGRNSQSGLEQVQPSAGAQLWIMLADCALYALFAAWFDQVYQGEFGAAKPWNFCLLPAYVCPRRREASSGPATGGRAPALKMDGLVKTFGSHRAVDGMSLEVGRAEIFALLGHNGAGKTTAINCITGMLPITEGYSIV